MWKQRRNKSLKRSLDYASGNIERFPERFCFQLTKDESDSLRSQFVTLETEGEVLRSQIATSKNGGEVLRSQIATLKNGRGQHQKYLPYAFTEQGVAMLSAVLRSEIVLIDGYVDLSVLERLSKKRKNVDVAIYTGKKTPLTDLDVEKFNEQYPSLSLKFTDRMHDRFLIIDNSELYHIGASIKDLGKKCFGFETMESMLIADVLGHL